MTVSKYAKKNRIKYMNFKKAVEKNKRIVPTRLGNIDVYHVKDLDRIAEKV